MKQLRSILSKGLVPKSDSDKDFVAKHTLTVVDPLDNKAAEGNDKVFRGATQFFDRHKDRHGYNPGEDVDAYDPQAKYNDQSVYHNDLWKSWRFTTQYDDHPLPQPNEVAGPPPVFEGADLIIVISKNLLSRYIKKAVTSVATKSFIAGMGVDGPVMDNNNAKLFDKSEQRQKNISLALKKLTKKSKSNGDWGREYDRIMKPYDRENW